MSTRTEIWESQIEEKIDIINIREKMMTEILNNHTGDCQTQEMSSQEINKSWNLNKVVWDKFWTLQSELVEFDGRDRG